MNRVVRLLAPAKINLRLAVLGRDAGGYHALETIFCGISLADTVEVAPGPPGLHLEVEGTIDTGPSEDNLVARAAAAFHETIGTEPAVRLLLHKRIPAGAGLGGGSSDAAATLLALNAYHDRPCDRETLMRLAGGLGSDVPFFLCGSPLALGWGRGERLLELEPLPTRSVIIAHSGVGIPTAQAFARFAERKGGEAARGGAHALSVGALRSWGGAARLALNDLEVVAFDWIPALREVKAAMAEGGAEIALLSGSGSCVFGLFPEEGELGAVAERLHALGCATWRANTLARWPALEMTAVS